MIDIKKELYHARLSEELKQHTLVIKELKEAKLNTTNLRAKMILSSLIFKHKGKALEVEELLNKCIKSITK